MKKIIAIVIIILFAGILFGCRAAKENRQTQMSKKVVLIVNGDDVGITKEYTDASLEAFFNENISSVSIFAPGEDANRALILLKEQPNTGAGVHLTLTGPVSPLTKGPSLIQENGQMWSTAEEAATHVEPEEARAEWDAQIKKVLDAGITVTHLDGHMGCYFQTEQLFSAAFSLAQQHNVPLISPYMPGRMPEELANYLPVKSYSGVYYLPGNKEETYAGRQDAYNSLLKSLPPGINYLFTHQGKLPQGGNLYGDMDLRLNDFRFWNSSDTHEMLKNMGISLMSSAELLDLHRKGHK